MAKLTVHLNTLKNTMIYNGHPLSTSGLCRQERKGNLNSRDVACCARCMEVVCWWALRKAVRNMHERVSRNPHYFEGQIRKTLRFSLTGNKQNNIN